MDQLVNKQLIFDFLAGKATVLQRKMIDEWCQEVSHEELFFEWLEEWEQNHRQFVPDESTALDRYRRFLAGKPAEKPLGVPVGKPVVPLWRRGWLIRVAVAAFVILTGIWLFKGPLLTQTYVTAYGQTSALQLTDGSRVTLNANSTLRVPRFGFGKRNREVWLEGEALFSVTHTASHQPFVVKTDHGADVIVLGTEFTLLTRPRVTQLVLQRGKVEFQYRQPNREMQQVVLKPGDRIDLRTNGTIQLTSTAQPANYSAWRHHRYVFDKTSLEEITHLFQENFGIILRISDVQTASLTISGAYPANNAEELLAIISEVLNVKVSRQGNEVRLSPQSL